MAKEGGNMFSLFNLFKKKKRQAKSKKTAKHIEKQSEKVMRRVWKQTEPIRIQQAEFEAGYPLWRKGEAVRKAGDAYKAIDYYEEARMKGYVCPALYKSYAMAYRKLNKIPNEIAIIEEGIEQLKRVDGKYGDMSKGIHDLQERLEKAKSLLK